MIRGNALDIRSIERGIQRRKVCTQFSTEESAMQLSHRLAGCLSKRTIKTATTNTEVVF